MAEINLLETYPNINRDVDWRKKNVTMAHRKIASQFGKEFFDGDRLTGYGGYQYDGRWVKIAERLRDHYGLTAQSKVLDVGCAKGFLLHDLRKAIPGITVAGIDISQYAVDNAMEDVKPFISIADAQALPFPDKSFDLVVSITTVHSLPLEGCKQAIREIQRVSRKHAFITVDAWHNALEEERLRKWVVVLGGTIMHVDDWKRLFKEIGYTGDYYWFIA